MIALIRKLGWPSWALYLALGIAATLALAALVWGVNHALERAEKAGEARIQARWDAEKAGRATARAELSSALQEAFNGLDSSLQTTIRQIDHSGRALTIRVKKEMDNDPRYSAAECELTPGVFDAVNAARRLSHSPAPAAGRGGSVPGGGYPVRLELGNTGAGGH